MLQVKSTILNECFIDSNSSSNKSSGSSNSGVRAVAIGFNFHSFPVEPSEYFNIHGLGCWIYHFSSLDK